MPPFVPFEKEAIPFSDPESLATYYFLCRQEDQPKWRVLFQD
jgi:hypothetical protein